MKNTYSLGWVKSGFAIPSILLASMLFFLSATLAQAQETAKMAIMKMEKRELEVKPRVEAEMKVRGSNDRKVVLDSPGESHMVVKYESLLQIVVVLFLFYFYFTLRQSSFL